MQQEGEKREREENSRKKYVRPFIFPLLVQLASQEAGEAKPKGIGGHTRSCSHLLLGLMVFPAE